MNSFGKFLKCLFLIFVSMEFTSTQRLPPIRPIAYRLPTPPVLVGPLSANRVLKQAEKVHQNLIKGPSSFVNHNGSLYAATVDNKIYDVASCPPRLVTSLSPQGCNSMQTCGSVTSIRLDPTTGHILALVNYIGLIRVDPSTGTQQLLFNARRPVNKRTPVYLSDFVVVADGTIVMADASDAYAYPNDVYICMDARPTSRLIGLIPGSGVAMELLPNKFVGLSGLELTTDGDLLVSESCRARIRRVSLKPATVLGISDFAVNLPSLPDNIRASGRGTYWVAGRHGRHNLLRRNVMDHYAPIPHYRQMGTQYMSRQQLERMLSTWTIVLELNEKGEIIGTMHDPEGTSFPSTTEVQEIGGILYIGSDKTSFVGRIILPETADRKINVDSYIQVLRSRCQLADKDVEARRASLLERYPHLG